MASLFQNNLSKLAKKDTLLWILMKQKIMKMILE